eukprot:4679379-Ditylum_brightwellii.AAC.1
MIMPNKVKDEQMHGKTVLKLSNPVILKESSEHVRAEKGYLPSTVTVSSWLRCHEMNHHNTTMPEVK